MEILLIPDLQKDRANLYKGLLNFLLFDIGLKSCFAIALQLA